MTFSGLSTVKICNVIGTACHVRLAQTSDCSKMANLAVQLGYQCTEEQVRERLEEMQDSNQYSVCVAELPGGQIAGWIAAYLFRSIEAATCVEISGLIVDQQVRCRGIGKVLLEAAEEWARLQGCNAIMVHCNITRERAHAFYSNNRFQHIKTQKLLHKDL